VTAGVVVAVAAIALAACGIGASPCPPPARPFAPWDARRPTPAAVAPPRDLADALVVMYQRRLRAPRLPGEGCRLRPTCSEFARGALARWRVLGLALIADRLFVREHPLMTGSYPPLCDEVPHGMADPVP